MNWPELRMTTLHSNSKDELSQGSMAISVSKRVSTLPKSVQWMLLWWSRVLWFSCGHLLLSDWLSPFIFKWIQSLSPARQQKLFEAAAYPLLTTCWIVFCWWHVGFSKLWCGWLGGWRSVRSDSQDCGCLCFQMDTTVKIFYSPSLSFCPVIPRLGGQCQYFVFFTEIRIQLQVKTNVMK